MVYVIALLCAVGFGFLYSVADDFFRGMNDL